MRISGKDFLLFLCSVFLMLLVGCAQNISVQFPSYTPTGNGSQLALIPPQNIHLEAVQDTRPPGRAEGTREAAFGVPMGTVEFRPPASDIVRDVIMSEFKNAGHRFTDKEQQVTIWAKILTFEVGTNTTPLYWDIMGNTKIEVEVMNPSGQQFKNTYTSTCQDRTYVWPGGKLVKKVMQSCITEFANTMRNDTELAKAMKNIAKK
ncbi:MAG: YajG family lipoprotein [Thermodesulfobacteriota bacterium]|nr:YajG family lipoprotein [Thermodesulfobacteriota bacterium]